ncbi:MAG TPA: AAA domain-containing protein [Chloroflexota bacterium]|nr:AAA domain-containing protein [Chloroflexota bacterium]
MSLESNNYPISGVLDQFSPGCLICGPEHRCDQPWIEGAVTRLERRVMPTSRGSVVAVDVTLRTAEGDATLVLGERFAYLAEGLRETTGEVALRAYHLRRGRDRVDSSAGSITPSFLSAEESLVVLEPDWLIDVTALQDTDYCLRQWLANRLAARPSSLQQLRGTLVHACFEVLCRDGVLSDDMTGVQASRDPLGLALLGITATQVLEAAAPHLERLRQWREREAVELFSGEQGVPCFESTLLCPELGLRGRVDLAFQTPTGHGAPLVRRVVELKTGKYKPDWPDPEFQVRGYFAMLAAHRRLGPDFVAQVVYTGGERMAYQNVPCATRHIHEVVTRRNQVVLALLLGHAPPAPSQQRCRKSGNRAACGRLSSLLGLDHCRGRDLVDAAAGDGDPLDAAFYARNYRLLRLEERAGSRDLATLWRTSAADRVAAGTAIEVRAERERSPEADGRVRYRLECRNESELKSGDLVLLSDGDPVRGEATVATLVELGATELVLLAMEPIAVPRLVDRHQTSTPHDRALRGLHGWLSAPQSVRDLLYDRRLPELGRPEPAGSQSENLNAQQAEALDLALRSRDVLVVQGPPGTGKTFLIARMARALAARGDRVLLAAWTNQAVDTVLHALVRQGYTSFARLGSPGSMDPNLLPYALAPTGLEEPGAIAQRLRSIPVLAGTVSTLTDPRLGANAAARDVLILDEAAQLTVAAAVGVLRLAPRFILVGDDQQLPPVVQSQEAAAEGLSLSPFVLLRPQAEAAGLMVRLREQYRMHPTIASWPSDAFYDGMLVAHASVTSRAPRTVTTTGGPVADPGTPLVLVDSGSAAAREIGCAARAVMVLVRSGLPAEQVGVVAPFRRTAAAVRRALASDPALAVCTVDTVDRFQGGEREAMVVCLGLEGMARRGHDFVDDPRRLNVAMTRARAKLVVVGDLTRAATLPTLAGFLHHCQEAGVPVIDAAARAVVEVERLRAELMG